MLNNRYVLFFLLVVIILVSISLVISKLTYQAVYQKAQINLQTESNRVENALSSIFYEVESLMIYTGTRIAKENIDDPQLIWKHIREVLGKRESIQKAWDWPSFGWLNQQNKMIVNRMYGVILYPYDLSMRKYTKTTREIPWKLHFDPPSFGIPTNHWALVGGIGIQDEKNKFLGILAVDFKIADLRERIKQALANQKVEFAIFDASQNIVIHTSTDLDFSVLENYFPLILKNNRDPSYEALIEDRTALLAMAYISHFSTYPFTIVTYIKNEVLTEEWIQIMTVQIFEIVGIGIFCLLLLYFFWKRICKKNQELDLAKENLEYVDSLAKSSDAAKEEFLRCTNYELMVPLNIIINHVDTLLKNLNHKIDTELVLKRQIELLEEILNHALAFKNLTNNVLDITEINIKKIIEECVIIHSKSAFDKSITISIHIEENIPPLQADELKIKQVFVGLLSRAIKYSLPKGSIRIIGTQEIKEGKWYIKIIIQDTGLGLSDETISNISERLDCIEKKDLTEMDFASIERIVHMHQGISSMESTPGKGTSITLLFPINGSLIVEQNQFKKNKKKRILPFSCT